MNQKTLIITIVAVVAVVVVISLWLTGAAGSGPLAGTLCPECEKAPRLNQTTLTLSATEIVGCEEGMPERWIQFSGTLKTSTGAAVSSRIVAIRKADDTVATLTTDTNGGFSIGKGQGCSAMTYYAKFDGDTQYLSSQSATVSLPASP